MENFDKKLSLAIIGCGWLGWQFIAYARRQYRLLATTRAQDLPVPAYPYRWESEALPAPVRHADIYLIALPPSASGREHYGEHMERLIAQLPAQARVLMISSTGVYPQAAGHYDETAAIVAGHPVACAEAAVRRHARATILRSGGQYGAGRIPLPRGNPLPDKRLNLVSGDNLCRALLAVLQAPATVGQVYNLVEPDHPWRSAFAARVLAEPSQFIQNEQAQRLIDGQRITRDTSFRYQTADIVS